MLRRIIPFAVLAILLAVIVNACAAPSQQPQASNQQTIQQPSSNQAAANAATDKQQVKAEEPSALPPATTSETVSQPVSEAQPVAAEPASAEPAAAQPTEQPTVEAVANTSESIIIPTTQIGPDSFPLGMNPLTGLSVQDPAMLKLRPAFISVSNFPVTARPQAGLSFAASVYEMYIGEGMTRFLAMFYGEYPHGSAAVSGSKVDDSQYKIGPIRSGRLPYESIRQLNNGFLVMASASSEVGASLGSASNIFGSDSDNINSALIDVTKLETIASANSKDVSQLNLTGNAYSAQPVSQGKPATKVNIFYSFLNQVQWTFDQASSTYLRAQDNADGSGKWVPANDRLTGQQLSYDNVIVLFANHEYLNRAKTLIQIDLLYTKGNAYLFRDGQAFPIRWTTENGNYEKKTGLLRPIRYVDETGKPVALKPGRTWVEVVDLSTAISEKTPGEWFVRFFAPKY